MGFGYFDGKRWDEVTRDERFFCQRLYELVRSDSVTRFVEHLSDVLGLGIPANGEWEIGYEVCFYRDLWQLRGRQKGELYSPKRTFDLCLFGESAIVIIEAKAAGDFDQDQNLVFQRDVAEVRGLTNIENVQLVGLCSSKCELDNDARSTFGSRVIRWRDLAERYGNDALLNRADAIYSKSDAFANRGRNANVKLSGAALLDAFQGGASWWVGRGGGGVSGSRFVEDVRTGRWRKQVYEVNTNAEFPPSSNYFGLAEFVHAVGQSSGDANVGS